MNALLVQLIEFAGKKESSYAEWRDVGTYTAIKTLQSRT